MFWQTYLPSLNFKPTSTKLLFAIGPDGVRIVIGMQLSNDTDSKKCSVIVILEKLGSHFFGERKEFFERFKFNRRNQESGENIDQYIIVFRTTSKSCGFCDSMKDKLLMESSSPETTRWKVLWGVLWQPYLPEKQGAPQSFKESPDPEISIPDVPADVDVNEGDTARSEPIRQTAQPRSADFRPDVREDLPAAITTGQTSKHPGGPKTTQLRRSNCQRREPERLKKKSTPEFH